MLPTGASRFRQSFEAHSQRASESGSIGVVPKIAFCSLLPVSARSALTLNLILAAITVTLPSEFLLAVSLSVRAADTLRNPSVPVRHIVSDSDPGCH